MYHQLIYAAYFPYEKRVFVPPKRFLLNFVPWHTAKLTCIFVLGSVDRETKFESLRSPFYSLAVLLCFEYYMHHKKPIQ